MLRIQNILVWIRNWIRGSMPLTNGSGCEFYYFPHWPPRCHKKTNFLVKILFFLLLFEGAFTTFSMIKVKQKSQSSTNQDFSCYICLVIHGSESGSIPLTNGSGSGSRRPKTCGSGSATLILIINKRMLGRGGAGTQWRTNSVCVSVVGGGGLGVSLCGISGGSSAFLKELKKPILKAKPKNMAQALVKSD